MKGGARANQDSKKETIRKEKGRNGCGKACKKVDLVKKKKIGPEDSQKKYKLGCEKNPVPKQ